jgi:hypothetical protein
MKRIGGILTAVVCTAALVLSFGSLAEKRVAATNPLAVTVTNTPLPTTASQNGTWNVGITGTPTVGISGTPTVGISGTPTVTVGNSSNSPVNVVDVSVAPQEPFETTLCSVDNDPGCPTFYTSSTFVVPIGKRLTVEYVSGFCFSKPNTSQVNDFEISDNNVSHHFIPVQVGTNAVARLQSVAQDTKLYYGPGTIVHLFTATTTGTQIVCEGDLSGYLQPAP